MGLLIKYSVLCFLKLYSSKKQRTVAHSPGDKTEIIKKKKCRTKKKRCYNSLLKSETKLHVGLFCYAEYKQNESRTLRKYC